MSDEPLAPPYSTRRATVHRWPGRAREADRLAVEEPLEIRVNGTPVAVTMRTPGHDEELALGFCLTEGLQPRRGARAGRSRCEHRGRGCSRRRPGGDPAVVLHVVVVRSLRQGRDRGGPRRGGAHRRRPGRGVADAAPSLPDRLREAQGAFDVTGGLHATGLFDADGRAARASARTSAGTTRWTRSSVARSSTVCCRSRTHVLCVSGRLSFELVQKAAVAGCPDRRRRRRAVVARRRARRTISASRSAASSATAASTSTRVSGASAPDRRAARRRRVTTVRIAEGAGPTR